MVYLEIALTKSSAGFDIPNRSAHALNRSAFFSSVFYGRLYRGSSGRRSLVGYVNSVQSAALLFDINGGSSPNEPEDTTMKVIPIRTDIYDIPLRLTEPQARALMAEIKKHAQNAANPNLQQASKALMHEIKSSI